MKFKEIFLSVSLLLSAAAVYLSWSSVLEKPWLTLFVLGYAVLFGFFLLLVKNKLLFWTVPPLSLILGIFFFKQDMYLLGGTIAGTAFMAYAIRAYIEEERAGVKILLRRVIGRSIGLFFTGSAIFFSMVYFGTIIERNADPAKLLLPESIFQKTVEFWAPAIGIPKSEEAAVSKTLYDLSMARIKDITKDYTALFPVLAAASYFFALKTVSVIFYYLAIIIIFILLKLFIITGAVKKSTVPAEKEILQ